MNLQTLKGFRDFLPLEARKRQYVIDTFKRVFTLYGFEPLETPVLEYDEVLSGKYGEEGEKLMYRFMDNGDRKVAMRYDQTVPTARVVAQYKNELVIPFKRYQIQPVWRADKPQKGRYREFIQCDIDTIGIDSAIADTEIIAVIADAYQALGFTTLTILVNDRATFDGLPVQAITIIDKLKKIGKDGVEKELVEKNVVQSAKEAKELIENVLQKNPTERLQEIMATLKKLGLTNVVFSPTLARGLDYYTGLIFEVEVPEYTVGSICGGGRYNNLIGMFAGSQIPAVGLAVGFDRTIEAMEELKLFPAVFDQSATKVLITVFSKELLETSLAVSYNLRSKDISSEIYLGEIKDKNPLEKQLKYADAKGIPFAIIIGTDEAEKNLVTLKDLKKSTQQQLPVDEVIQLLQTK